MAKMSNISNKPKLDDLSLHDSLEGYAQSYGLDEPFPQESLEVYAKIYQEIPEDKRKQLSSQLGGYQAKEFYQGMMRYMHGAAEALAEHSCLDLAESASFLFCGMAYGLLYDNFGARVKIVSHSLLDDKMSEDKLNKAAQTPIHPNVEEEFKKVYSETQPLEFYEGMFSAAVLVFTTAYRKGKVGSVVLDNLIWNYAYLGRIITRKRSQN